MAAALVFLIIELATPTLIFICFVVGSIAAGIYAESSPEAIMWQLGLFVVVSMVLLPFTRKFARKISKPSPQQSNVDRMLGQIAMVTQSIDPDLGGKVQFEGEVWVANASEKFDVGTKVKIISVAGTRVHVQRADGSN